MSYKNKKCNLKNTLNKRYKQCMIYNDKQNADTTEPLKIQNIVQLEFQLE